MCIRKVNYTDEEFEKYADEVIFKEHVEEDDE
jgi:hypothetical protein